MEQLTDDQIKELAFEYLDPYFSLTGTGMPKKLYDADNKVAIALVNTFIHAYKEGRKTI